MFHHYKTQNFTDMHLGLVVNNETRYLPFWVKGLSYVEILWGGQSSFHVQTTSPLLLFQFCEATGALECMFWEILQKLAELHSTEDVLLTPHDGIL